MESKAKEMKCILLTGNAMYGDLVLEPFSIKETKDYIKRFPDLIVKIKCLGTTTTKQLKCFLLMNGSIMFESDDDAQTLAAWSNWYDKHVITRILIVFESGTVPPLLKIFEDDAENKCINVSEFC